MTLRLAKRQQPGIRLLYVTSESRSGVEYAVQHIRRAGQNRWFCSCPQFQFRCLARKRWCKHIRAAAAAQGGNMARQSLESPSEAGRGLAQLRWTKERPLRKFGKRVILPVLAKEPPCNPRLCQVVADIAATEFDARGLRRFLGALRAS